ncbi:MAG: hypothetical protein ABSB33_03735 [Tepidisphaeraceae bacterium]|jgi:hypothetical protein
MDRLSSHWRSLNPRTGAGKTSAFALASLLLFLFFPGLVRIAYGQIYVGTSTGIGEYTTSGATVNPSLVSGLAFPWGLASDGDNLFVTNSGYTSVAEYTTSGALVNPSLIPEAQGPLALEGNDLFVTLVDTIGEYTTSGATVNASLFSVGDSNLILSVAVEGSDVFVIVGRPLSYPLSNQHPTFNIGEYTTSGATVNASLISIPESDVGVGLAVEGTDLFVTNEASGTIAEYTTSGTLLNPSLVSGLNDPQGLAVLGNDLFVSNYNDGNGTIG